MIGAGSVLVLMLVTVVMGPLLVVAGERPGRWSQVASGALGVAGFACWVWAIGAAGSSVVP